MLPARWRPDVRRKLWAAALVVRQASRPGSPVLGEASVHLWRDSAARALGDECRLQTSSSHC